MGNISQRINMLAIALLESMGNLYPTQEQIDLTENLLNTYMLDYEGNTLKLKKPLPKRKATNLSTYFWHYLT